MEQGKQRVPELGQAGVMRREEEDDALFGFRKAELQLLEGHVGILSTTFSTLINTESLLYQVLCTLNHFSCVQLFATPQTVACQASLACLHHFPELAQTHVHWGIQPSHLLCPLLCSSDSPGKNTGSGLPCSPPGDLRDPGIKPMSHYVSCTGRQVGSLPLAPPGKPHQVLRKLKKEQNSPALEFIYCTVWLSMVVMIREQIGLFLLVTVTKGWYLHLRDMCQWYRYSSIFGSVSVNKALSPVPLVIWMGDNPFTITWTENLTLFYIQKQNFFTCFIYTLKSYK